MTALIYMLMAAVGAACAAWGMVAAHRSSPPGDILGAVAVLAGVCAFVTGILLAVIPNFFVT